MAEKIVVTSGKGGVGKTTVTANLGSFLASYGKRVVLIDIDFSLNNLDVVMGLENQVVYDLLDVVNGRCRLKQALVQDKYKKNLYILPSDNVKTSSNLTGQNIKLIVETLSNIFDYVILDSPAGIDLGFYRAISSVDKALVVTTPTATSLRDANKVMSILRSYQLDSIDIIVNRARGDLVLDEKMMSPLDIAKLLQGNLIGVLPEEDSVFLSTGYKLPENSESAKAYRILSENILKNKRKIFDVTDKYSGFFGSIKRSIRKSL